MHTPRRELGPCPLRAWAPCQAIRLLHPGAWHPDTRALGW